MKTYSGRHEELLRGARTLVLFIRASSLRLAACP